MDGQHRLLLCLGLFVASGCDSATPHDVLEADDAIADADLDFDFDEAMQVECPAGTHPALVDPELGVDPSDAHCEPDTTCDALDCGEGSCVEEGGIAACICPEGYDGEGCGGCAWGYGEDDDGTCIATGTPSSPRSLVADDGTVEPQAASISVDGHRVEFGSCTSGAGCANPIPMTGRVSELFREVDIAAAQFVQTRCAGSAVVSISRNGRRVYKRGFGKTSGSAAPNLPHCPGDAGNFVNTAPHTLPDTPHQIGSVSKFVTAATVRRQIADRIQARGLTGRYADPSEARLLDPDLELLPPNILRYLDQTRSDAVCPPVPQPGSCTRAPGCNGNGPDVRWQNITVGDLLGHTAGLAGSVFPNWRDAVIQAEATRGYNSKSDWEADFQDLLATTKFPVALQSARSNIAGKVNADVDDVMFVSNYDALDDEDIYDETLKIVAGGCLSHTPVGQTQSSPSGVDQGYHNSSYRMLGRVSAYLSGESGNTPEFSAPNGFPELHDGSALDELLTEHGIEDGVLAEHSIETRRMAWDNPAADLVPDRRDWRGGTYYPTVPADNRPFCVWNGSSCDFGPWRNDTNNANGLRLPWNFATGYFDWDASPPTWIADPPSVPDYRGTAARGVPTGALAAEAPALLKISNLYRARAEHVFQGRSRDACGSTCSGTRVKGGSMAGARAHVRQFANGTDTKTLPPSDSAGHLTMDPDPANWVPTTWSQFDGIDAVSAVNQSDDENGNGNQYRFDRYVAYGISRVDWDAVDKEIADQERTVVGKAMDGSSRTYTWYADDHREVYNGTPRSVGSQAFTPRNVNFPSTRIASDVMGVAISTSGYTYAWYDDGHRSRGTSWDLDDANNVTSYSLPPGQTYEDIVAIAIAGSNRTYSWYRDGTRAIGQTHDLDAYGTGTYSLPPGQSADEIVGIAIDWAGDNHVYTEFRDGSVAEGSSWNLDAHGYDRGDLAGMSMEDGDTTMWFKNGYMRKMSGTPADNMVTLDVIERGFFDVADGYEPSDVVAVSDFNGANRRFWYSDGRMSYGQTMQPDPAYPNFTSPSTLLGVATANNGRHYSWFNTGVRASGTQADMDANSYNNGFQSPQHFFDIAALAIDSGPGGDGRVWTLYRDGAVSRGRSWNLGQQTWPAP